MYNVNLIACDPMIGPPRVGVREVPPTVEDLLGEMDRLRIDRAVVRHRACLDNGPYFGNRVLIEEIAGQPRLLPAWVLTSDGDESDFDAAATVGRMLEAGVRVAWMAPKAHGFSAQTWCAGALYAALQQARVPLLVDYDQVTADEIHHVCAAFPDLPLVLLKVPRLGRHRLLYPLLAQHPRLHLCFSLTLSVHEGFADLCRNFGEERWVFGSGYPEAEGGASLAGLFYAGLPESALTAIGGGNLERLLSEVRHG